MNKNENETPENKWSSLAPVAVISIGLVVIIIVLKFLIG
jgi:hypothetical protein